MSQRPSETLYLHLFVSASCSLTGSWSDLFSCRAPPYCSGEHDLPVVSGSLGDSLISSGTAVLAGSGAELSSSQALCFSRKSWQDAADLHTITSPSFLPQVEPDLHVAGQLVQDVRLGDMLPKEIKVNCIRTCCYSYTCTRAQQISWHTGSHWMPGVSTRRHSVEQQS